MTDPYSTEHAVRLEAWPGRTSTLAENFDAQYDEVYRVDSFLSLEYEVQERWRKSIREYEERTGRNAGVSTSPGVVNALIQPLIDPENRRRLPGVLARAASTGGIFGQQFINPLSAGPAVARAFDLPNQVKKAKDFDQELTELANPEIPNIEAILQQVFKERGEIQRRATEVGERAGFLGTLGGIAGGVAGSFSERDPLLVGSLAIPLPGGVGGAAIAKRIVAEGVIGGVSEFVQQETAVQPTRELLGEPTGDVATQVLFAGLGGGALRGAFEGGAAVFRRVTASPEPSISPEEASAQLRQALEQRNTPESRAALALMDKEDLLRAASPYGETSAGLRQFTGEVADIEAVVQGKASTAIGRFLPEVEVTVEKLSLFSQIARERRPGLFDELNRAQDRLAEIDSKIATTAEGVDNITAGDVLEGIDPDVAARVKELEARIAEGDFTDARRQREIAKLQGEITRIIDQESGAAALRARIRDLTESLNEPGLDPAIRRSRRQEAFELSDQLANTVVDKSIRRVSSARRDNLRSLRRERAQVQAEHSRLRAAFDTEIQRVETEERIKSQALGRESGSQPGPIDRGIDINPARFRPDVIEDFQRSVELSDETLDDTLESVVRSFRTEDGMIDLGDGTLIDPEFRVTDPDNPANEITANELATRLEEDADLLMAMTECTRL